MKFITAVLGSALLFTAISSYATEIGVRASVLKVIDGDTFIVRINDRNERVRLASVDAPEIRRNNRSSQPHAEVSRQYLKNILLGQDVTLMEDPIQGPRDDFNRLLAYVYLVDNGVFINADMIRQGHAKVYRNANLTKRPYLESLELQACQSGLGMWKFQQCFVTGSDK